MLNIPSKLTPGDTITWKTNFPNYKSSDYTLSWSIRGTSQLDVTATRDGDDFTTTITSTQSATLTPGLYAYQAYLTDVNNERLIIGSGQLEVTVNLAAITEAYDGRSTAQKLLDAVNETILNFNSGVIKEYRIKERIMIRQDMSLTELIQLRDKLKIEVAREQASSKIEQGLGDPRRLYTKFG